MKTVGLSLSAKELGLRCKSRMACIRLWNGA